mmetsp:Transcript_22325/g.48566  ORF Transcript_22325/g.48566 Transcript_22325/m.48566 type:complete len:218 (-) Transcript_22325:166-819(-)
MTISRFTSFQKRCAPSVAGTARTRHPPLPPKHLHKQPPSPLSKPALPETHPKTALALRQPTNGYAQRALCLHLSLLHVAPTNSPPSPCPAKKTCPKRKHSRPSSSEYLSPVGRWVRGQSAAIVTSQSTRQRCKGWSMKEGSRFTPPASRLGPLWWLGSADTVRVRGTIPWPRHPLHGVQPELDRSHSPLSLCPQHSAALNAGIGSGTRHTQTHTHTT